MKAKRLFGALLLAGIGLTAAAHDADAQAKKKKEPAVAAEPPVAKKAVTLSFSGVTWGQSPKQVADAIDKILDDDYRPLYKEVQPGVKMKALDAQLAEDKSTFRRSRIDFGKTPTGYDSTSLRGEYTYQNKECVLNFVRKGDTTYFFFIQEKLWKIIEEQKLNDKSPLGKTYAEAVVKLSTTYGVPGRVLPADGGRSSVEVDWKDGTTHVRAIQRSDTALGLAFEDNATLANINTLRAYKPPADDGIDPDVAAAVRGKAPDPPPPSDKDKQKKK